jgi:hypothetical protein
MDFGSNYIHNSGKYFRSSKSSKRNPGRYGSCRKRSCPPDYSSLRFEDDDYYDHYPQHSEPKITTSYSYSDQSSQILNNEQIKQLLPLIVLLAKQLSENQSTNHLNFVNPTLETSNSKYNSYRSQHLATNRYGDLYRQKQSSRGNKNKLKVRKIIMEDMIMDRMDKKEQKL